MCNSFTVLEFDEVDGIVRSLVFNTPFVLDEEWPAMRRDVLPGDTVPVIVPVGFRDVGFADAAEGRSMRALPMKWGFDAPWKKGIVFNTRIESALAGGGMWDEAVSQGRCVVPAVGFYEPHRSETVRSPRTGRVVKKRYRFSARDEICPVFFLAAVAQGGRFSIVTTVPNESVAAVHDRMPMTLSREEVGTWFSSGFGNLADRSAMGFDVVAVPSDGRDENGGAQLSLF